MHVAGGRRGCEQVDCMENHWSRVLIALSPPICTVHAGPAINLSSLPRLPGLENEATAGIWSSIWCILDVPCKARWPACKESHWLQTEPQGEDALLGGFRGCWSETDAHRGEVPEKYFRTLILLYIYCLLPFLLLFKSFILGKTAHIYSLEFLAASPQPPAIQLPTLLSTRSVPAKAAVPLHGSLSSDPRSSALLLPHLPVTSDDLDRVLLWKLCHLQWSSHFSLFCELLLSCLWKIHLYVQVAKMLEVPRASALIRPHTIPGFSHPIPRVTNCLFPRIFLQLRYLSRHSPCMCHFIRCLDLAIRQFEITPVMWKSLLLCIPCHHYN